MTDIETTQKIHSIISNDVELGNFYFYFIGLGFDNNVCLEKLTKLEQLKNTMAHDVVQFVFKKMNGEIRTAFGTRAEDVLKAHNEVPGGKRRTASTFPYFDIEKEAWRCFKPEHLIEINLDYCL